MQALEQCRGWLSSAIERVFPAARAPQSLAGREERVSRESPRAQATFRPSNPPDEMDPLVVQMLGEGRAAILLHPEIADGLNERQFNAAYEALCDQMALVPEGVVSVEGWRADESAEDVSARVVRVEGFYLDRYAVTNSDFEKFVRAGGYEDMALWDEEVWPAVLGFVDRTGEPGPRFWENGAPSPGKAHHPVVGICWFEAAAYARWVGKRLPSDPEWVKAGSWPIPTGEARPAQRKFPWGDSPDCSRANLWGSSVGDTAPVDAFPQGASVGQVYQLIGNVWEWTANHFAAWNSSAAHLELPRALKSIRGGAFDTYFTNHATCQFQSGEVPLARKHNIGFRCAVAVRDVCAQWQPARPGESQESDLAAAAR
jgi:gamma-glutamyl hercynylcysteine S-oxide synthase